MAEFQHPLQLFSLDYPDGWQVRYQEETGGVMFVHASLAATALSLSPVAVTGDAFSVDSQVVEAASRMNVHLDPAAVSVRDLEDRQVAYGEGEREGESGSPVGTTYRFWVIRHGALALYGAQLGPGLSLPANRTAADRIIDSLRFPEILPPTAEEFRQRVLDVIEREYSQFRATPAGQWGIEVRSLEDRPVGVIGLENLYRSCLLGAEVAGAMIRSYLDQVLASFSATPVYPEYAEVRERLLPQLKSEQWVRETAGGDQLTRVEFAPGLLMCFAIDEPTRMAYVTRDMLEHWGLPLERLQEVASDNLGAKEAKLEMTVLQGDDGRPCALVVNTQDGYDATRLVLPNVRETFAEELGDEYLVGLPNRDFLVAFSSRSPELAAGIARQVRQDYHQMDHPLTQTIYRVRADQIEPADL